MQIAVVVPVYHQVRVFELLLTHEHHCVTCFGRFEQLERSVRPFDLLILDAGKPAQAAPVFERLGDWQPAVRRLLVTNYYETISLVRPLHLPVVFWPCSRRLFMALVEDQCLFAPDEVPYGP